MTSKEFIDHVNELLWIEDGGPRFEIDGLFVYLGSRFICTEGRLRALLGSLSDLDCSRVADLIADVARAALN